MPMLYFNRITLVFLTQFICTLSFIIYCLLIVINFAEMFLTNLTRIQHKGASESWVRERCTDPVFAYHMTNSCDTAESNSYPNPYLVAIQLALDGLHLCGSYSCEKILVSLGQSFKLSIYTWIASAALFFLMVPICILPFYRKWQRNLLLHENHLGDNALVPNIYIRDIPDNNMHNIPFRAHAYAQGIRAEPRQRRLLGNNEFLNGQNPEP